MLNNDQLKEALNNSPSPDRLTPEYLESRVASEAFERVTDTTTVCLLTTVNGFEIIGKSSCADPANYNQEIGEKVAHDDALRQLWPLEGYLLREKLALRDSTTGEKKAA